MSSYPRLRPTGVESGGSVAPAAAPDKYDAPSLVAAHGPRWFHVMAKPAGSTCNLDCDYCFYLSKETLPDGPGTGRMSDEVLDRFVQQYIAGVTGDEVVFSWQGGEPMLMGLDFFRRVVALQTKYAKPGQRIDNDLQTNGTSITEEWCAFLKENRFLVGVSIDGPRQLHDRYRVTRGRQPTFDRVMNSVRLLQKFGVPFNTLTCVASHNGRRPLDVYRFLRNEVGSTYMQFIPIVAYKGFEKTAPHTWNSDALPKDGDPEARPGHPNSIVPVRALTPAGMCSLYMPLVPWPLLVLELHPERSPDCVVLWVTGGLLVRYHPKARLEFREMLGGRFVLTGIYSFHPRLPRFFFGTTQAIAHLAVMRAFRRHPRRVTPGTPPPGPLLERQAPAQVTGT